MRFSSTAVTFLSALSIFFVKTKRGLQKVSWNLWPAGNSLLWRCVHPLWSLLSSLAVREPLTVEVFAFVTHQSVQQGMKGGLINPFLWAAATPGQCRVLVCAGHGRIHCSNSKSMACRLSYTHDNSNAEIYQQCTAIWECLFSLAKQIMLNCRWYKESC